MQHVQSPFSLAGKNLLLTGASSALGQQVAACLADAGACVALIGRDAEKLADAAAHVTDGRLLALPCDVRDAIALETLVDGCVEEFGPIDGFVHAAGNDLTRPLRAMRASLYEDLYRVHAIAGFELARLVSHRRRVREEGAAFVFLGSIMGVVAREALTAYCGAKGGVLSGCRALALELAPRRIRVNCVSPGYIDATGAVERLVNKVGREAYREVASRHPLGLGYPEDIGWACVYLLSDAARWVTGANLVVDGGYSSA